jgi:hypothetical protein
MVLVGVVLVASIGVGWLAGGHVRNLGHVQLRMTWLVFASVGAQLVLGLVSGRGDVGEPMVRFLLAISHVLLVAFIAANRYLPGMLLVLMGTGLNALVIVANGGMPVSPDALVTVGGAPDVTPGKHQLLTEGTALPLLADVIPLPVLGTVVSVGDIVLAAGVGLLVVGLMRRFPPRPGRRLRPRPVPPLSRRRRKGGSSPEEPGGFSPGATPRSETTPRSGSSGASSPAPSPPQRHPGRHGRAPRGNSARSSEASRSREGRPAGRTAR